MNKKKELKKNIESHHFMDKLLTKLKMGKHGGEDKGSGRGKRPRSKSLSSPRDSKRLISWEDNIVTPENIMEFGDQLHDLLEYVKMLEDVVSSTYEYPKVLGDKLKKEALELRSLFRDVRAAASDIERLQKQRSIVKKEKCLATKKLDKLREDEIKELESIICAYAKPLFSKWETIKNTQKVDVVENFMSEVTCKHRAIEILQELVRRKLSKISKKGSATPFILKKNVSSTHMNNKIKMQDKSNWNLTPFLDIDKFDQNIDKVVLRGTPDRDIIRMNRRKRQKEIREEKRRQTTDSNINTSSSTNADNGDLDLQLVPIQSFPVEDTDDTMKMTTSTTTRAAPIINIEYTSDDDSVSMSSSEFTIENFAQGRNIDIQSDLQHEMRNVLQALFGELRHLPQIGGFTQRNRHNNSGNDLRSPRTASH